MAEHVAARARLSAVEASRREGANWRAALHMMGKGTRASISLEKGPLTARIEALPDGWLRASRASVELENAEQGQRVCFVGIGACSGDFFTPPWFLLGPLSPLGRLHPLEGDGQQGVSASRKLSKVAAFSGGIAGFGTTVRRSLDGELQLGLSCGRGLGCQWVATLSSRINGTGGWVYGDADSPIDEMGVGAEGPWGSRWKVVGRRGQGLFAHVEAATRIEGRETTLGIVAGHGLEVTADIDLW